jgi:hypothetical protein
VQAIRRVGGSWSLRTTGVVSHCGSRLLADLANRTTLTGELSLALAELRKPRARHDPGRVLGDMAVAIADGATISDIAVLADQGNCSVRWRRRIRRVGGCLTSSTPPSLGWSARRVRQPARWSVPSAPKSRTSHSRWRGPRGGNCRGWCPISIRAW